jgi:hypothetical protein
MGWPSCSRRRRTRRASLTGVSEYNYEVGNRSLGSTVIPYAENRRANSPGESWLMVGRPFGVA